MSYHLKMRSRFDVRKYLFITLLVASNLAFANHATLHASSKLAGCNWCLCQGHTPAAPSPVSEPVLVESEAIPAPVSLASVYVPLPVVCSHQPRAPPSVS